MRGFLSVDSVSYGGIREKSSWAVTPDSLKIRFRPAFQHRLHPLPTK